MFETRQPLKGVGWIIGCVLLACLPQSAANGQCVALPSGLVSWWPGDGDATDIIGSNDGLLVNGATFAAGQVGQAFSLDGANDYIDVGVGFDLNELTLEAWVFIDPTTNTGERRIISKDNIGLPGTRKLFALKSSAPVLSGNDGRPAFGVLIGSALDAIEAPTALSAGWHHLAGVRSATEVLLYVDGALAAHTAATIVGPIDSAATTVIGQVSPTFNGEFFNGLIDEASIYNRALSASEIVAIFLADSAGKCKTFDGDGDGVNDADDACPDSDLSPTILIGGDDTGVANELVGDGCTLSDLIVEILAEDPSTDVIVQFLVDLKGDGVITGQEMGAILKALNSP